MKKNVKIIFCDNAGKNKTLGENCVKIIKEINFKFTSSVTPQKNGIVERVFATLYFWMRAVISHSGLHENLNTGIWLKCAATMTKHENIRVNPLEEKCVHKKFFRKMLDYAKHFSTFGEMKVVQSIASIKSKL